MQDVDLICCKFSKFMEDVNLIYLGFQGPCFTWRRVTLHQLLDIYVGNEACFNSWADSSVLHLARIGSDHRPLLLIGSTRQPTQPPASWQNDTRFVEMFMDVWNLSDNIVSNLINFTIIDAMWNREVFGDIGKRKARLLAHKQGIEKVFDFSRNDYLHDLEMKLKKELNTILTQEKSL
ncbi:hypothetical protein V6N13_091044 [Hibiscus sabdariffa]|uniref:Endonuclease/exonuclease/phosphatase domain-containing protein n=1 Tax=Hibiscus sabdariffa TaxID=183260 RepID=A0ABR2R2J8_9ROSI